MTNALTAALPAISAPAGLLAEQSEPDAKQPVRASDPALLQTDVAQLIAQEYYSLRRMLVRQAGDAQTAADILNDAICTTWEKWLQGRVARPREVAGYVFQVAMNLLRNHHRLIRQRPERWAAADTLDALSAGEPHHDAAFETAMAARVRQLIGSMSSRRDRIVLVRFYLEEMDKQSICGELGLSPRQFDKVMHRARRRLRHLATSQGLTRSSFLAEGID